MDRGVSSPEFTEDSSSVTFLVADDRREYPAKISVAGGLLQRLSDSELVVYQQCSAAGHTAFLASSDRLAPEIFAFEDGKLRK